MGAYAKGASKHMDFDFGSLQDGSFLDSYFNYFGLQGGIGIILGVGIVIFLIIAIIAERKTRILFPERPKRRGEDEGLFDFGDDDDDE